MLTGKAIVIVSPQSWGKMFVSKHHYAVELAKAGNEVYFLNPPSGKSGSRLSISAHPEISGLFLVSHRLWFPYSLKFHASRVFHLLMKGHIKAILKKIGKPIDMVWSFDLGNTIPFSFFPAASIKVFLPVDEPVTRAAIDSAKGADLLFSVTREILDKYKQFGIPSFFINHGVSDKFLAVDPVGDRSGGPVRVGFSGNLLRPDIDRETLMTIISGHPEIEFECWGAYEMKHANMGGQDNEETRALLSFLKERRNVILHGAVASDLLPQAYSRMDAFLICYDIARDQSKGTNYHKLMEFISTGKVVISNNVTTYKDMPNLVVMPASRESNAELPNLFRTVIEQLETFNAPALMQERRTFAQNHRYSRNLEKMDSILSTTVSANL